MHVDWSSLKSSSDPNSACQNFYNILYSVLDQHVPKTAVNNRKKKYPPWFSHRIISDIKLKARCRQRWKATGDANRYVEFSRLRNKIKHDVSAAYRNYIRKAELSINENPTKFWSLVNLKKS